MKTNIILFLFTILTVLSCKHKNETKVKSPVEEIRTDSVLEEAPVEEVYDLGNVVFPVDVDTAKIIKEIYVYTVKNCVPAFQYPNFSNDTIERFFDLNKLEVIEETTTFYGIIAPISSDISIKQKLYISKNETVELNKLKLRNEDLLKQFRYEKTEGQENNYTPNNNNDPNKILKTELTTLSTFNEAKRNKVDLLIKDNNKVKKVNGKLIIQCSSKKITYKDNLSGDESHIENIYLGEINFLNTSLIQTNLSEAWYFDFIDNASGEVSFSFNNKPLVSPNKKNIICVEYDNVENSTSFDLYLISDLKIYSILNLNFTLWKPVSDYEGDENIFWSSDGYLYLKVIHKLVEESKEKYQYIRIKVL